MSAAPRLPFGCQIGVWHRWQPWALYVEGEVQEQSLLLPESGVRTVGKVIVQQRICSVCGELQLRSVRS